MVLSSCDKVCSKKYQVGSIFSAELGISVGYAKNPTHKVGLKVYHFLGNWREKIHSLIHHKSMILI